MQIIVLMIDAFCCKKFEAIGESSTNNNNNKFEDFRYKPVFKQEQEEVGMQRTSVVVSAEKIAKRCNDAIAPPHGSNSGVTLCVCASLSLSLSLSAKRCTILRFALAWRVWYLLTDFSSIHLIFSKVPYLLLLALPFTNRDIVGIHPETGQSLVSLHFKVMWSPQQKHF